jgi:hypothetical protein
VGNTTHAVGVEAQVQDFPIVAAPVYRAGIKAAILRERGGELCPSVNRDDSRFLLVGGATWVRSIGSSVMFTGTAAVRPQHASQKALSPVRQIKAHNGSKAISGTG